MEDFVNYKKPSMFLIMPYCTFKCGEDVCQNSDLAKQKASRMSIESLVKQYLENPITKAVVFGGMEPFCTFYSMYCFISYFRTYSNDDIVIYTGYYPDEIKEYLNWLKDFDNIIIKFGRYIPNENPHYDEVLGVELASNNQYAVKLTNDNALI